MLARLFGKKCDHPMADIKSAQALLNELPKNDALKSVTELTDWIESVTSGESFKLADQLAVLSLLDETAQSYSRKLSCEYFTLADLNTFQGNRLCLVLGNLARTTAAAYVVLFDRYCSDEKAAVAIKASVPLLVARAVSAIRAQLKYAAMHYGPHDEKLWHTLAQLYRHAEQQLYLNTPLKLYHALSETSSVKREAGQLMAWYACGINSLHPRVIHLVERLFVQFGDMVEVSDEFNEFTLFGFDLAHPLGSVRINPEATMHPLMRYISMAQMQDKLVALIKVLEKNSIPKELSLCCAATPEWVTEAAQHILRYLVSPPQRLGKRSEIKAELNVLVGYENVIACSMGQESSEPVTMRFVLENACSSGFRAVLSGRGVDSVQIGQLFGIQTTGAPRLGVVIVRNLLRDAEGQLHVGAELLSSQVSNVTLQQSAGGGTGCYQSALWLHARAGIENGTTRLLMPLESFSMQRSFKTNFDGKDRLLIPAELYENGPDYDLVSFRVIEQELDQD